MKTMMSVVVIAAAFTTFALKAPGWAQAPRPSQHGSVSQHVANTTITIEYNRPADEDVLRVQATPRESTYMETLAFYFPVVEGNRAELVLHWGTVVVPLTIEVK